MSGDALREIFAEFGFEWDDKDLQTGVESVNGAIGVVKGFAAVLASSAIVQGIQQFAREFEEQAGHVEDTASSLGLATTELQELNYAAEQGGVKAEQMAAALATLQRNAVGAASGNKTAAAAFRALGVDLKNTDGSARSAGDILDDIAANIGSIEDPARRTALAQQVLGESGRRLLTILHDGEGGLASWRGELDRLGGGLSEEAIEAAGAFGDEMNRLKVATDSVRSVVATALLPVLTRLVSWVTQAQAMLARLTRGTHVARLALLALGIAGAAAAAKMLRAWAPVLRQALMVARPFLLAGAAILAAVLVIDDLITLFQGGDSAIGRFLDQMVGVGASANFVRMCKEAWEGLTLFVRQEAIPAIERLWGFFTSFAGTIATAFTSAIDSIRTRFSGLFSWLGRAFEPVGRFLDRLGVGDVARSISGFARDTADFWSREMHAPVASVPGAAGAANSTTNITHGPTTIHVDGARDPRAVAAEIERRQRNARSAAHPRLPQEG